MFWMTFPLLLFCVECMFVLQTKYHLSSVNRNRELNLGSVNLGMLCWCYVLHLHIPVEKSTSNFESSTLFFYFFGEDH